MSLYKLIRNNITRLLFVGLIFISPGFLVAQGKQNKKELENKKSKLKNEKCVLHRLLNGYQIIEAIVGFWRRQHANTEHLITGHSFESNKTTE